MSAKVLPATLLGLLLAAPAVSLAKAPAQSAISFRARTTVSHQELADNTAKGLATPVGIASGEGYACEIRCILADPSLAPGADSTETLQCEAGEVRGVTRGFEVLAMWAEDGAATFQPVGDVDLSRCD
ncbi:MAG: hypothetical protein AAGA54_24670 [Myxococcota bacterium]